MPGLREVFQETVRPQPAHTHSYGRETVRVQRRGVRQELQPQVNFGRSPQGPRWHSGILHIRRPLKFPILTPSLTSRGVKRVFILMAFIPPLHPVSTSFVSVLLGEVAMQRLQPVLRRQGQPQDAHAHPHGIKAVPLPHLPRPEVPDERDAEDAPD